MAQPVNPNTDIPMSLQVEKLQQIRNTHSNQQQGQLAQELALEEKVQSQRVNTNNETDRVLIREKNEENKGQREESEGEENDRKEQLAGKRDGNRKAALTKGKYIDIKV
ncbi:MAG TPA: hypothetical protein VKY40_07550 [Halanaerobiales bacterium]|nr:hypothetical protein [Halanaerobiales bacterium]